MKADYRPKFEPVVVRLTVAGAAQVESPVPENEYRYSLGMGNFLLPVELQRVNHTASTNSARFYAGKLATALQLAGYDGLKFT